MSLIEIFVYLFIGALSGTAAGLLGVGGGLIIVPLLIWFFSVQNSLPYAYHAHISIATSLAVIVITAISAILAQQKKKAIRWAVVWDLIPGIIIGSWLGGIIAAFIERESLIIVFIIFLVMVSYNMWPKSEENSKPSKIIVLFQNTLANFIISVLIGVFSVIVGIGGGTMTVPYLSKVYLKQKLLLKNAIAVSSTLGFPIALAGSLSFYLQSLRLEQSFPLSLGYIYLPAFLLISLSAYFSAKSGVYLTHYLNKNTVSRFFSILLMIQSINLWYKL